MSRASLGALQQRLGYAFSDESLLLTALTHPSYGSDHHVPHYQRLEFLGDAVLELSCSHLLFTAYPGLAEGQLTLLRAELVREESLADMARALALGPQIHLSVGEARTGGADKPSILSDVLEAVFGAAYVDGGFDQVFLLIRALLLPRLPEDPEEALDPKTRLQTLCQRKHADMPEYVLIEARGPDHNPEFEVEVRASGAVFGRGVGHTKQAAQQEAARAALRHMKSQKR